MTDMIRQLACRRVVGQVQDHLRGHRTCYSRSCPGHPQVTANPKGVLSWFILGLILFGSGVGFFKCCISPLVAEQYEHSHPRAYLRTESSGDQVIIDPGITISRVYM